MESQLTIQHRLENYFEFQRLGTNWKTEILAGLTTFITMAYIVLVNPSILHEAGMPLAAVTAATCISAAFGSLIMGIVARYPIALAPGMGLNAYFTYTVVKGIGVPWQVCSRSFKQCVYDVDGRGPCEWFAQYGRPSVKRKQSSG